MPPVAKRIVLHFPGFEPLDAAAHHARYRRSAGQSASVWAYAADIGPLTDETGLPAFTVDARGPDWHTKSRIHCFDHNGLVAHFNSGRLTTRLFKGYTSAGRVVLQGGLTAYFRHAWRFALFFLFPFVLVALALGVSVAIAAVPFLSGLSLWHCLWTIPAGVLFFRGLFLPAAQRLHTLHLFADWRMAVALGDLADPAANARLEACVEAATGIFHQPADEYLVTSHSMGANVALHVIGAMLERNPACFSGKRVTMVFLGSAALQCALLRPAAVLRQRIGLIAACPDIVWIDVQCLTDAIHFYNCDVVAAAGYRGLPSPKIMRIRFKTMLTAEHYRKIRRQLLRVHRQYVLGSDRRSPYDFTLLTSGPFSARDFAGFTMKHLPPIGADGSITMRE